MKKIGLIYGPPGGSTEKVAKMIWDHIGKDKCDIMIAREIGKAELAKYDNIIFGISTIGTETWQSEKVKSGWFTFKNALSESNMKGKKIAIFGLGDHIRYPDHFVDAMGDVYEILQAQSVDTIGKVDTSEYQFTDSKSVVGNQFVGLPIDEDFEPEKTTARITEWLNRILPEMI